MNRADKIEKLAKVFVAAGINEAMALAISIDVLDEIFPPLRPIERDEAFDRAYIPMLGDSEVQTKGKGSTFRIVADDDRMPICGSSFEFEFLTNMALYIRKEYGE
jgi:hypothetical protein